MALFPEKMPLLNNVGQTWLNTVRSDRRMVGETAALAVAGELALHIRNCGSGELPSPTDLARPVKLTEDAAIEAVNSLVARGFIALVYRPRISFATLFFVRPGPYQQALLQKKPGKPVT